MSNDYSRINFDPGQDYLGVLLQQGRPLMDADWNALVAQLNRRTHVGSYDTFGPAVVPETTPDGFLITPIVGGFTIGRGRIYVDGILAENHGAGTLQWDAHLAEEFRTDPVAWDAQPYGFTPTIPAAFPYLVYVDVWQREVGPLEDPREDGNVGTPGRLVDVAVGVDTTARLQTVWQVRTIDGLAAGTDCSTPLSEIEAWAVATAPSAGRLTTATGVVTGEPDPCLVPPLGGYKGAENQLYRLEVHEGGAAGTATFKWSRDNASVQARVQTIPSLTEIVVDSIGKDEVLRFNDGDWIEITNDERELAGELGIVRRIAIVGGVSDSTRTITLDTALAAGDFPVNADDEPVGTHTRLKKWNQAGIVKRADGTTYTDLDAGGSTGLITIPADATQLLLENGILVSFGIAAGVGIEEFRRGDYWVFAARTNDASVEILTAAPPRGIHHHYSKLAVVTSATEADDCREIWPPDRGCCTVVVRPGESIQAAINSLPPTGGCVCLKSGVHEIAAPLELPLSNVIIHGEAPGTVIRTTVAMQFMLFITNAGGIDNIEIAHVTFEYAQSPSDFDGAGVLLITNARNVRVLHCELLYTHEDTNIDVGGALVLDSADVSITDSRFDRLGAGVFSADSTGLLVADNSMQGLLTTSEFGTVPTAFLAVLLGTGTEGRVRDNHIENFFTAVRASGIHAEITGNRIRRLALPEDLDTAANFSQLLFAIRADTSTPARVHGNDIDLTSLSYGGVHVTGQHDEVSNNLVTSGREALSVVGPVGVFVGNFGSDVNGSGDFAKVLQNRLTGFQLAIVANNPLGMQVAGNTIVGNARDAIGIVLDNCSEAVVSDNVLRRLIVAFVLSNGDGNRVFDNTASELIVAAFTFEERGLEFTGNSFEDVANMGIAALNPAGNLRVANTRIAHCGYAAGNIALALGILQVDPFTLTDVAIEDCEILETGISADGELQVPGRAWGIASLLVSHLKISDNRVSQSLNTQLEGNLEHRALIAWGVPAFTISLGEGQFTFDSGAALITDNIFQGPSLSRLIDIRRFPVFTQGGLSVDLRFEKLTFSGNHCDHDGPSANTVITADIFGTRMVVTGNQVNTPFSGHSFGFGGRQLVATMSNHSTGDYVNVGSTVPAPLANFNVITP